MGVESGIASEAAHRIKSRIQREARNRDFPVSRLLSEKTVVERNALLLAMDSDAKVVILHGDGRLKSHDIVIKNTLQGTCLMPSSEGVESDVLYLTYEVQVMRAVRKMPKENKTSSSRMTSR